ncbi:hypothetical protein OH146_12250 [Salinibacterium sp. SYSU T00001]|uniref:F510_1955 family glycosylhydrolase n=1 Tax=Homoserinimonas sedimenticola TaxID=2986805 RepID=UPI002235D4F4|nr:hypothetical protein [Salinibacterium sedimenticola]MCW4386545.1 hypothetical protein [Salinibacterium sedimenticola]
MSGRSRTGLMVLAGAAAAALLSGCSTAATEPVPAPADVAAAFEHIHGLEVDPESGALLVATHGGIFQLTEAADGTELSGPLGGLDIDAMGFTLNNGVAYASGHPGPGTPDTFGSPHLGLIRSPDLGRSWVNVSLTGTTDFHDLTISLGHHKRIYGLDSSSGTVRKTDDGQTWTDGATLAARDILAPDENPDLLYATTEDGLSVSTDGAESFILDPLAPRLYLIASGGDDWLVGIDVDGTLWYQPLEGGPWSQGGVTDGVPQAMTVDAANGRVIIADDRGIVATDDYGDTWEVLRPAE